MFKYIMLLVPLLDVAWFAWTWWRTRHFEHRAWWRTAATFFFALMLGHYLWMIFARGETYGPLPPPITLSMAYVWHLLILPVLFVIVILSEGIYAVSRSVSRGLQLSENWRVPAPTPIENPVSRRHFLSMTAVAAPPLIGVFAGGGGYIQSRDFRIRRIEVELPTLPTELDGVTIAHVSDIHAGTFVDEKHMARIAAATNDLRADIIALPGDLINYSLNDLPAAINAVRKMDAPGGVYLCQGNHDLFESREKFDLAVKEAGLALLVNESAPLRLRGRDVEIHGLRWGTPDQADAHHHSDDAGARENLEILQDSANPEAFSILLAHHPHAFDAATDLGIPLILSGHTHGGQLMLTQNFGAGSLMYRYWSGLYRKGTSRLVVSNGVGNWLPLRINAPAEIVHITLRSTAVA